MCTSRATAAAEAPGSAASRSALAASHASGGPWTETKSYSLGADYDQLIHAQATSESTSSYVPRPGPDMLNGGSADIKFPPNGSGLRPGHSLSGCSCTTTA